MNNVLVAPAPHIKRNTTLTLRNLYIILALLPSVLCSVIFMHIDAFVRILAVTAASYAFDVVFSFVFLGKFNLYQ